VVVGTALESRVPRVADLQALGTGGRRVRPPSRPARGSPPWRRLATRVGEEHAGMMAAIADTYITALRAGGTLFFRRNGGSAADAQHIAAEYVVRYGHNRRPLPRVALTTDTSLLTACANDLGTTRSSQRAGRTAGPFAGRAGSCVDRPVEKSHSAVHAPDGGEGW